MAWLGILQNDRTKLNRYLPKRSIQQPVLNALELF